MGETFNAQLSTFNSSVAGFEIASPKKQRSRGRALLDRCGRERVWLSLKRFAIRSARPTKRIPFVTNFVFSLADRSNRRSAPEPLYLLIRRFVGLVRLAGDALSLPVWHSGIDTDWTLFLTCQAQVVPIHHFTPLRQPVPRWHSLCQGVRGHRHVNVSQCHINLENTTWQRLLE